MVQSQFRELEIIEPRCIKYQSGKVFEVVLGPQHPDSSALATVERELPSRELIPYAIKTWFVATAEPENEPFIGSNYAPTKCSDVSTASIAFTPLILPTESDAECSLLQDSLSEGSLSIEVVDEQEILELEDFWMEKFLAEAAEEQVSQHQQRIRSSSAVSLRETPSTRTSFMLELAHMMARAKSGDHVAQEALGDLYMDAEDLIAPKDVQTAIDWYLKADNQGRINRYRKAADQGDSIAQCNVGVLYFVIEKYYQAMNWYQKAAKQGCAAAQRNIGSVYHQGLDVSQNYALAMSWYRMAAEQEDAAAQCGIGRLYYRGLGVSKDYAEALTWIRKAVEQGHVAGRYLMYRMYNCGQGVPQDKDEAMIWLEA
ncbi:hypothetical protein EC991_004177 [Linnemannia zychae]|nr:hypothetical protein EC991_004177 [Linnemannia zychae]